MFPRKKFGADKITCKRKQGITHTIRPNLPEVAFADNVTRSGKSSWRTLLRKGSSDTMCRIQVLPFRVSFKRRPFLLCFISSLGQSEFSLQLFAVVDAAVIYFITSALLLGEKCRLSNLLRPQWERNRERGEQRRKKKKRRHSCSCLH